MHEILVIYLPAAVIALIISGFLGRFLTHRTLLYVGVYCIVVPVVAGLSVGEVSRRSVGLSNSAGLLFMVLALWLDGRKRTAAERPATGEAVAE